MNVEKIYGMTLIIMFVFLVVGTFFDLSLATYLFDKSKRFSLFGERFTPLVLGMVLIMGASFLFWTRMFKIEVAFLLAFLAYLGFSVYGVVFAYRYMNKIGILFSIITLLCSFLWIKYLPQEAYSLYQKTGWVIVLSTVLSSSIVELLKQFGGRVRYRSLHTKKTLYSPWYVFQKRKQAHIIPNIEERKSFPSGHAQWAMLVTSLSFNHESILILCILYGFLMMFSRMFQGAHYLSDVVVGGSIGLVCVILMKLILFV